MPAAERVFARYGFRGATMQQIADAADLPKANLHYYFGSKQTLYLRVLGAFFTTGWRRWKAFPPVPIPKLRSKSMSVKRSALVLPARKPPACSPMRSCKGHRWFIHC